MSYSNTFTNTAPVGGIHAADTGDQEAKAWRAALYLRLSKNAGFLQGWVYPPQRNFKKMQNGR